MFRVCRRNICLHISDGPARCQEGQEVGGWWSVGEATCHVAQGRDSSLHGSAAPPGGSGNSGGKVPDLVDTISFLAGVSVSGLETVGNGNF